MAEVAVPITTEPAAPDTGNVAPDLAEEVIKWRTMSRKHEQQSKENAAAAQKLAAIEEANKSDAQKNADKVSEYEKRAQEAELKALRYEVGVGLNIPTKLLRYLTGATKEELEANAAQLLADFGTDTDPAAATSGRPREALRTGATNTSTTDTNPNKAINDRIRQAAARS